MSPHPGPPRVLERILRAALGASPYRDDILGDLQESYARLCATRSVHYAGWWYRVHAVRLASRFALRLRPRPTKGLSMDSFLMDVRFAVRSLAKRPALTLAVVVTLALGIGANAAVFGVIDALLLHPYDMPAVDRLVMAYTTSPRSDERKESVSAADFLDWRRGLQGGAIEHLAAWAWWDANLVGRDEPERVLGFYVSPEFFNALDAHAAIGRTFLPSEEVPANAKRVVLSDGLWRRRFGADPAIVGRTIRVDAEPWIVVGVMPASFTFPSQSAIWAPLAFDEPSSRNRAMHFLTVLGRLAPHRTLADAQAELRAIEERLAHDHREDSQLVGQAMTLSAGMADVGTPSVLALWQAAGIFVLLIACANIANLLLARSAERERETAIRLALGSSRSRIVRGSLLESGLLVLAAFPVALVVASAGLRLMHAMMPARIVRYVAGWDRMGLSPSTLAAAFACAAAAALVFGVAPAVHGARGRVSEGLKSDGRAGAGPGPQRMRRALVVAEIALALPLLVAAIMSASTITQFLTGWQGYDPNHVLTLRATLPDAHYADGDSRARFARDAVDRLRELPGVEQAAAGNVIPALDANNVHSVEIDGQPVAEVEKRPHVEYRVVSPAYFSVLRLPILSGRDFEDSDSKEGDDVAIVNAAFARRFWPNASPIGRRVRASGDRWARVVGVCGDVVQHWFDSRKEPTFYRPLLQAPTNTLVFTVRTAGEPVALASDARAAIARVDPTQPVYDVMSLRRMLSDNTISLQYIAGVMGAFAGLALMLAVLGLYAVMTYLVAQRAREIGVRIALGATGADVKRLALGQAARLTAVGLAVGFVLALALGRAMEAGLLGLVSSDIRVTAALAAALGATALAASYLPARRAAAVDPIVALRSE